MESKVTFDSQEKKIIVHDDVKHLNMRDDVYAPWKTWILSDPNNMLNPAISFSSMFMNTFYFILTNDWKIEIKPDVTMEGMVLSENSTTPFITKE